MARLKAEGITRQEIADLLKEARQQNKKKKEDKEKHVRDKLKQKYEGLEYEEIRRNGHVYNALDYMMQDLEGQVDYADEE